MRIDIWSDIVCPWCSIGRRRLERALELVRDEGTAGAEDVEVVWRSFQLDPDAPVPPAETTVEALGRRYAAGPAQVAAMVGQVRDLAAQEGLTHRPEAAPHVNTHDAHRLLHLAREEGGAPLQAEAVAALMTAYHAGARDVSDHRVLREVAGEVGLPADRVDEVLAGQEFAGAVAADVEQARAYGATGVPFVVVADRYGVAGAQPVDAFADAIRRGLAEG
ncbi:DsbA family oxidoreductase [Ornithinimicrobium sp. W1665]|uniref:DsbA family oxidoreductase n=1 Tax=Ornithinimicrobium sp. W1665 TaxID=3416666 RepID=UPI003CF5DE12